MHSGFYYCYLSKFIHNFGIQYSNLLIVGTIGMMNNFIQKNKQHQITIFLISLGYILPIILLNEYYKDDVEFFTNGLIHGFDHARPIKEILIYLIGGTNRSVDIRPIPIILSSLLLSYGAILLQQHYLPKHPIWGSIAGLFILFNPFFIEDLLFGLDALSITLSIFLIILIFTNKIYTLKIIPRTLISMVLLLISFSTYQVSITFALTLLIGNIILEVLHHVEPKKILKNFSLIFSYIAIAQLIYLLLITPAFPLGEYASQRSQITSFNIYDLWLTIKFNLTQFNPLFLNLIQLPSIIALLPIFIFSYIKFIFVTHKYCSEYDTPLRVIFWLIALLSPFILYFATLAPMLILENPVIRARVIISFGLIPYIYIVIFLHNLKKYQYTWYLILPIFYSFILVNVTINAQKASLKFQDQIASSLYYDLIGNKNLYSANHIFTYGTLNQISPVLKNSITAYPFISHLSSNIMYGKWEAVGLYQTLTIKGLQLPYVPRNHAIANIIESQNFCNNYKPITSTGYYNIYNINDVLVIDLSKCVKPYPNKGTTPQGIYW